MDKGGLCPAISNNPIIRKVEKNHALSNYY